MFETDPLQGVVQLDIDAKVVGIEPELVARRNTGVLVDVQRQGRDAAVDGDTPMPVGLRSAVARDQGRLPTLSMCVL